MPEEAEKTMTDEERILRECFSLVENPFDPKKDPQSGLDFQKLGVSLAKPLDIFRVAELKSYFAPVGAFSAAVTEIENFFQRSNYPAGGGLPPAFLIQGTRGVGLNTLAFLLGHEIKTRNAGAAGLRTITVPSEHWGRLLFDIKKKIKQHVDNNQVPNCEDAFGIYSDQEINAQDPSVFYLTSIFNELAQCMNAPPLLLVIDSITWDRRKWMTDLYSLLSPLNVVLIFLTEERRVFNLFPTVPKPDGFQIELDQFDRQMAEQFLARRLNIFRSAQPPQDKTGLFPFANATLDGILPASDRLSIKKLENIFRIAFNAKLKGLIPIYKKTNGDPPPKIPRETLLITYNDVSTFYDSAIRLGS